MKIKKTPWVDPRTKMTEQKLQNHKGQKWALSKELVRQEMGVILNHKLCGNFL